MKKKRFSLQIRSKKASFDYNDYIDSMDQMKKMGGLGSILNMIPGIGGKVKDLRSMVDEKGLARQEAIVRSMTPKERANPDLINPSRKARIAKGCGLSMDEVNRFIKQFNETRKMMKKMPGMMKGKGKKGMMGGLGLPF